MGSISYLKTPGRTTDQELRAYLAENLHTGHRVVAQATRPAYSFEWSRELFAAVDDGAGNVTCHVLLGASHNGEVCVKALHEDMGPCVNPDPPSRVLDALTPTDSEYARIFRKEAADALQRKKVAKAMVGRAIRFERSIPYSNGDREDFRVESMSLFTSPDGTGRYRAPKGWWMRTYRVLPDAEAVA
ncbi:hypothetical protein M3G04_04615 [Dietzia cinnamea]|uniref:hypothetical protein n=1 Tax=Dietzia cinnamea TaxID=321318 RepID=UPI00223B4BA9|nr:hypothetical protein [Dietzia cinnamea]MCT2300186.1 hypothetical protein [Dietzia cinnamea]